MGNDKKDRSHLKVVNKEGDAPSGDEAFDEAMEEAVDEALEEAVSESSDIVYNIIVELLTLRYASEWDDFLSDGMGRDEFVRTVIELDDAYHAHPVIVFDSAPAPTKKAPKMIPERYGILDLAALSKDDEDTLFWNLECEARDYRMVFIPKEALHEIEKQIHELFGLIISDYEANEDDYGSLNGEFEPAVIAAILRETRILFSNISFELGFLGGLDEDEDEDEAPTMPDFELLDQRLEEEMEQTTPMFMDCGRYQITLLL